MKRIKVFLPVAAAVIALGINIGIPDSPLHPAANHHYFAGVLIGLGIIMGVLAVIAQISTKFRDIYQVKAPFYAGVLAFLAVLDILTVKTATLPVLYFPSLDRIFGVLFEDTAFIRMPRKTLSFRTGI